MALPLIGALAGAGQGGMQMYMDAAKYKSGQRRLGQSKKFGKESLRRDTVAGMDTIQNAQGIEGGMTGGERLADIRRPGERNLANIKSAKKSNRKAFGFQQILNALKIGSAAAGGISGLSQSAGPSLLEGNSFDVGDDQFWELLRQRTGGSMPMEAGR